MNDYNRLFFVVAGPDSERISECKPFSAYEDAADYLDVLKDRKLFNFLAIRKQVVVNDTREFVSIKSYTVRMD